MLNARRDDRRSSKLIARALTDNPAVNPMQLGCWSCIHRPECGGLCVEEPIVDCLDLCCGNPEGCTRVCANAPERFVAQRREINGFDLNNVPRTPDLYRGAKAELAELIYHGSRRVRPFDTPAIALRLADLIDFRNARPRFDSRQDLCDAFRIDTATCIYVTGVDHDARIEPWWALGTSRKSLIKALAVLGIEIVSTPNFSLLLDNPRTDDLHAMKRIAIAFAEFQAGGIPCALHAHGRTQRDFERWADFIRQRPEVGILAYEFITGSGQKQRKKFHLEGLAYLSRTVGRELDLIVRGDPNVIPFLREHFRSVIYIDTTAFVKTQKRQIAVRNANHRLDWVPAPSEPGAPLDTLLRHNVDEQLALLRAMHFGAGNQQHKAA